MSTPGTPSDADPRDNTAPQQDHRVSDSSHKRPWGWIALAGILAAGIVALAIYAINTNSDLDDANAKVASQQKQIASQQKELEDAQSTGGDVVAAAKTAYENVSSQLGATQQNTNQASEQAAAKLDQAEQAAADAKGTADEVQTKADAAQVKAEAAATCAQSFLAAFKGVFAGATLKEGVQATVAELKALQPKCASALGQDGSAP